ncbi:M28 family metallopeptidase [Patulibacter minatonensis]|uniref:M28 family metallopeptidase n=1 Tax=Patulibacter minatonensis TaxID=298163 RepID=UPI00047A92C4|nr:M28 family metallopeptidase [Patulibacter minatonensis]
MSRDRPPALRIVLIVVATTVAAALLIALLSVATGERGERRAPRTTTAAATTTVPRNAAAARVAGPASAAGTGTGARTSVVATGRPSAAELDAQVAAARRPVAGVPRARTRAFDADRALSLVRLQVAAGPRPAGSDALAAVRRQLVRRLPRATTEAVAGSPGLVNVVGRIPGRAPAVVLAAHYDTQLRPEGFVGANDSAAGTAVVLEAARALSRRPRPAGAREVRFVLFDGEELPPGGSDATFEQDGLRGSKAYAVAHRGEVGALVLADYVANRGLRLPRELGSDPRLWARVRAAAGRAGVGRIFAGTGIGIVDDHLPFLESGVPAVDLIDWDYAQKNTAQDTIDRLSLRALDATGETVVGWLDAERRR